MNDQIQPANTTVSPDPDDMGVIVRLSGLLGTDAASLRATLADGTTLSSHLASKGISTEQLRLALGDTAPPAIYD